MDDILHNAKLRKYYYKLYFRIMTSAQWMQAIYKPTCPMNKTHLSPIILSVRKIATDLIDLANKLEKELNDRHARI